MSTPDNFASALLTQYVVDAAGNVTDSRATAPSGKGEFGSILGGIVFGALASQVFLGLHLSDLGLTMEPINEKKSPGQMLMQNERPRYHYLDFPTEIPIVPSIADFKHYFSVNVAYLEKIRPKNFVCRLSALFREDLSQRFAACLSRIGLPEIVRPVPAAPALDKYDRSRLSVLSNCRVLGFCQFYSRIIAVAIHGLGRGFMVRFRYNRRHTILDGPQQS